MSTLSLLSVIIHVVAGTTTLIAGPIAIFTNRRYIRIHKVAGMAFFIAMNVVCLTAIIGYFKQPDKVFYQFLLGISVFVYGAILRGIRCIQIMKGKQVFWFDFAYTGLLGLFGFWMLGMAAWNYSKGMEMIFPILFTAFGSAVLKDAYQNYRIFSHPERIVKMEWQRLHTMSMIGAMIASTTAFLVNVGGDHVAWYIQWFAPTILMTPLQIYWSRKIKKTMVKPTF